jgi:hypothetical protein
LPIKLQRLKNNHIVYCLRLAILRIILIRKNTTMSKGQDSKKSTKKQAVKTMKEKKAAKREKKNTTPKSIIKS